jgi:hypothetical protein
LSAIYFVHKHLGFCFAFKQNNPSEALAKEGNQLVGNPKLKTYEICKPRTLGYGGSARPTLVSLFCEGEACESRRAAPILLSMGRGQTLCGLFERLTIKKTI